VEGIRYL